MADCRAVVDLSGAVRRALAGTACALLVAGACSSGDDDTSNDGQGGSGEAAATPDPAAATGPFATGRRTLTVVDPSPDALATLSGTIICGDDETSERAARAETHADALETH